MMGLGITIASLIKLMRDCCYQSHNYCNKRKKHPLHNLKIHLSLLISISETAYERALDSRNLVS